MAIRLAARIHSDLHDLVREVRWLHNRLMIEDDLPRADVIASVERMFALIENITRKFRSLTGIGDPIEEVAAMISDSESSTTQSD